MTAIELVKDEVRRFIGWEIPDDEARRIIWEHTGFPCFWDIPREGSSPEECMRAQVRDYLLK